MRVLSYGLGVANYIPPTVEITICNYIDMYIYIYIYVHTHILSYICIYYVYIIVLVCYAILYYNSLC